MTEGFLVDIDKLTADSTTWINWGSHLETVALAVPLTIDPAAFSHMQGIWADLHGTYLSAVQELRETLKQGQGSFDAIAERIDQIAALYREAEKAITAELERIGESDH